MFSFRFYYKWSCVDFIVSSWSFFYRSVYRVKYLYNITYGTHLATNLRLKCYYVWLLQFYVFSLFMHNECTPGHTHILYAHIVTGLWRVILRLTLHLIYNCNRARTTMTQFSNLQLTHHNVTASYNFNN